MKLEIHLKKGIGELVFGSSIEDIIKIIGSPTEVEEMGEDIDYPTTVLHYEELGLSLFFDNNSSTKLTCIDLDNPNATLFGEIVIELSPRKIEELMIKNNIFNETKEKEDWGEMRISFEDYSIDFYFIDEKLVSITFGK
ncbi:MAG: hypothetical protein WC679_05025 [Bacteroidales bacterium]|jgi:hypothetical protein